MLLGQSADLTSDLWGPNKYHNLAAETLHLWLFVKDVSPEFSISASTNLFQMANHQKLHFLLVRSVRVLQPGHHRDLVRSPAIIATQASSAHRSEILVNIWEMTDTTVWRVFASALGEPPRAHSTTVVMEMNANAQAFTCRGGGRRRLLAESRSWTSVKECA